MTDYEDNPKLYCGTYAKYNDGSIAGEWMDMTKYDTAEDFFKACAEIHQDEDDPEFMFQDYECFPRELYSESMSTADIEPILEYAKLTPEQRELVTDFCDATGESFSTYTIEQIEDSLDFEEDPRDFSSIEEQYGYYCADNFLTIPDEVETYFDYKSYGEDMLQDCSVSNGKVFNLGRI